MTELKVNLQGSWKRILAMITVAAMCFTVIYVSPVSAATSDKTNIDVVTLSDASAAEVTATATSETTIIKKDETTAQMKGVVKVTGDEIPTMEWNSSDDEIATVNESGVVTAVTDADATVAITLSAGKLISAPFEIQVEKADPAGSAVTPVESVTVKPDTLNLEVGKTGNLSATVAPSDAANADVEWATKDSKIATVDQNGTVKAVATGTTDITATAGGKEGKCTVTVKEPEPTVIAVTGITLNKTALKLTAGKSEKLTATVAPATATNKTVTWTSSNTKAATVANDGTVKAVAAGTATITAKAGDKTANCVVTVTKKVTPKVTLNAKSLKMKKGDSTKALKATSNIKGDKIASVKSSNKKVVTAKVKGQTITLKAAKKAKTNSKATITVTMKSGAKATVKVTVTNKKVTTKKITLNKKTAKVKKGKKLTLTVTRNPINATEKITWKSSNKKIATVKNGKVTVKKNAKAGKKVTITAKTANGKKATCKITVTK